MGNALYNSNQEIPEDMLLGNLLFMNIRDMRIPEKDLIDMFNQSGVPTTYIRKISAPDVFRRATSSIKGRCGDILNNGKLCTLNVDEVKCDENEIVRIISAHGIDEQKHDVEFKKLFVFKFDRTSENMHTNFLVNHTQDIDKLANDVNTRYQDWRIYHNRDTVRNLLNRIVQSLHPVNLMPTGICKFIPSTNAKMVYNVKTLLGKMSAWCTDQNAENIAEVVPVIDTVEQRNLIEKNYTVEIVDEMNDLAFTLKNALSKGKLTSRQAYSYMERFSELKKKAEEYDDILNIYSEGIRNQLKASLQLVDDNTDDEE